MSAVKKLDQSTFQELVAVLKRAGASFSSPNNLVIKVTKDEAYMFENSYTLENEFVENDTYRKQNVKPASYAAIRNAIGSIAPDEAERLKHDRAAAWER